MIQKCVCEEEVSQHGHINFLKARYIDFIFWMLVLDWIATFYPGCMFFIWEWQPTSQYMFTGEYFVFVLRFVILFSAFVNDGFFHADRMSYQMFVTIIIIQILCNWPLELQLDFTTTGVQFKTLELGSGAPTSVDQLLANPLQFYFVFFMSSISLRLSLTCKQFVSRLS